MVRLGELDSRSDSDCNADQSVCNPPVQDFEIERVIAHAMYDTPKYANDIALIRLRQSATALSAVSPLCLPLDGYAGAAENLNGINGIIAGWGSMTASMWLPKL
jgi:gram-positive specific serine protease